MQRHNGLYGAPRFTCITSIHRKRQNGDYDAPDFIDSVAKRLKERDEALACYLLYEVFFYMQDYDYLSEVQVRSGIAEHIPAVHRLLVGMDRGSILLLTKEFREAANRITQKYHNGYNIFVLVANEVIELIVKSKHALHMKRNDLY